MIDVIEKLKQLQGQRFTEVYQKHTFECYRLLSDGCMQSVTLVVFDAGPGAKAARYFGHATSEQGRTIMSNAHSSLDLVLESLRWSDLDPNPSQDDNVASAQPQNEPDAPASRGKAAEIPRRELFDALRKRLVKDR